METREGERKDTDDIIFQRIGVPISVSSTKDKFDTHSAPLQALAVSNHFGITFVAHPQGFCVTKTSELLRLADGKDGSEKASTVQGVSIANVPLAGVSILALSSDGLTLAACVGGTVHFFSVPDLVHRGNMKPFHSTVVSESQYLKEFIWCMAKENAYLALSCEGMLGHGEIGSSFNHIDEKVIAVDWSADGRGIALLTKNKRLIILSSDFQKQCQLELPEVLQNDSADSNIRTHVDSIKWIQRQCIVIGCIGVTEEGEECEYPVHILTSKSGDLFKEPIDSELFAFDTLFTTIDASILPPNSGPYLLLNYLDVWDMAVFANRRSADDHIVLLGWVDANGKKEPVSLEIVNDKWHPRIELQENDDDNLVVGIAMDRTSIDLEISIPTDDGGSKKLPPSPVLMCMTIEGKLNLFSFTRIAEVWHVPELVVAPSTVPMTHALVVRDKEDSEVEKSSLAKSDSKMPGTKENVNAKALQPNKLESQMVKMGGSETLDLQKAGNEKKPVPIEKSPSTTLITNEASLNAKTSKDKKCEKQILKVENATEFQMEKTYDMLRPVQNEKPFSLTVKTNEADMNAAKFQTSNQDGEMSKPSDINSFQLQRTSDVLKPMLNEKSSSIKNQNEVRHDMQTFGIFSSGPSSFSQTAQKSFVPEGFSNSLPSSSPSVPTKGFLQGEGYNMVGSDSTKENESGTVFPIASNFNSQVVTSKLDLIGSSNKDVPGKGYLQNARKSMPKAGFGTVQSGSVQLSSHPLVSSMPSSKPSSDSASTAVGQLVTGVKDSYQGKASVLGGFSALRSTNVASTTVSSSSFHSGPKSNISSIPSSEGPLCTIQSQQGSDSLVPVGTQKVDLKSRRPSGMSEIEADFSRELEKVRNMAKEVDDLMSNIEGDKMLKTNNISFSQHAVLRIEDRIKKLSKKCNNSKERLENQLFEIQNLHDKIMQVDAWRIYMQSIIKQATDQQYQDLRDRQKLNPELDIKRQSILKEEHRLNQQIVELEGHLRNLEMSKFEVNGGPRKAHQKQLQNTRQLQSMQSFYNTVNSQLEIAEQLAVRVTQQMEALNISPEKPAKSKNAKKESLFKSIGLAPTEACFSSPDLKEKTSNSYSLQKFAYSPSYSATKESPIKRESVTQEPDSVRRRRDPIDSEWANVGTVKTTVKRALLAPSSKANRSKSVLKITESDISQLITSSEMFVHEASMSPMYKSHLSEGKRKVKEPSKSIDLNTSSDDAVGISLGPSSESIFKWSNYNSQSIQNRSGEVSTVLVEKSGAADNGSKLPYASLVADKAFQIHGSDVIKTSSASSAQPKIRTPSRSPTSPFGLSVGSQSEVLMGSKPSTGHSSLERTSQPSFGFPKAKTSIGSTVEGSTSSIDNRAELSQQPHESASAQIKSVSINSGREAAESNNTTSAPLASRSSSLLQVSSPSASLKSGTEYTKSSNADASNNASEVARTSSGMQSGKPFAFSIPTISATVAHSASVSSLNSGEAKSSINPSSGPEVKSSLSQLPSLFGSKPQNAVVTESTSQPKPFCFSMLSSATSGGQNVSLSSGHETRTTPQVTSLFGSKPQNAAVSGASPQPKFSPSSSSSLSAAGGQGIIAQCSSSLTSSAVTASLINQSITPQVSGLGVTSSNQSQLGLTNSQLGSSTLGISSSSEISSLAFAATPVSSMGQTSTLPAFPLASSSPQPKPLHAGFTTAAAVASSPSFSFSSTSGSEQFSAPVSGSSGFGQFPTSVSGSLGFGSQISSVSSSSPSFGFSNLQVTPQQSVTASIFGQNVAPISVDQKTFSPLTLSTLGHSMVSSSSSAMTSAITNEEDMEEEASTQTADTNIGGFSGFGLGSTTPTNPKSNPFGGPLISGQSNSTFSLSVPTGELFRPPSFSIPAAQSSPQSSPNLFGSSFGSGAGISPLPATASAFGQPAQPGAGQQALGSALGAFGQSRQIGLGSAFGAGFGSANPLSGGGFKTAASGGGFAGAASGGGFAGAAGGGGFAGAAGGGFAAAASGGGFSGAAGGGGFAAAASGGGFGGAANAGGGFQSFSGNQGGSGFSSFGGSSGPTNAPQSLFTQIRK